MATRLKILLVDDDATTLAILAAALEAAGHEVIERQAALGTIVAIARERPDVVVLDVRMPGLSGDRLAELIADQAESSPLVVLHSSMAPDELAELARRSRAAGFIEKTSDPAEFVRAFERITAAPRAGGTG